MAKYKVEFDIETTTKRDKVPKAKKLKVDVVANSQVEAESKAWDIIELTPGIFETGITNKITLVAKSVEIE